MIRFIFDLDSILAEGSIVEIISEGTATWSAVREVFESVARGRYPYIEGLIRWVHLLNDVPLDEVGSRMAQVCLCPCVSEFIREHSECCTIITEYPDCWVNHIRNDVSCELLCSTAGVGANGTVKLASILREEKVVSEYKSEGWEVVFTGGGMNGFEAMRAADISIMSMLQGKKEGHMSVPSDYLIYSDLALTRQLEELAGQDRGML